MQLSQKYGGVKMNEKRVLLKDRLRKALEMREKKAVDLSKDLNIPKSAISQYLSGKSQQMDSERLFNICRYLDVNEAWMLGFNVQMEREMQKKNDTLSDIVVKMITDPNFCSLVESLYNRNDSEIVELMKTLLSLDDEKINGVKQMLSAFLK